MSATLYVKIASYVLASLLCLGTLIYGLLPGLLAACLGYLLTLALSKKMRVKGFGLSPAVAAALDILVPLIVCRMNWPCAWSGDDGRYFKSSTLTSSQLA